MRRLYLLGLFVALTGCQNTSGPLGYQKPSRVDDPMLSIPEQQSRGRLRYSYIDLALTDIKRAAPIIRKTLSHEQAPLRSWLLFHDDDYAAEWIGIYGQTPEPPQVPQLEG